MNTKTDKLVTIGIPTYNRADGFLRQAIQSAVAQTWPEVEVVISDNCSSDNTEELVRSFDDPRIRYFRQEQNIGPFNNFNFCLEQARGKYFLMLHDDDLIDSDLIETCMQQAGDAQDIGIIRTGTRVVDEQGHKTSEYPNRATGSSLEDFCRNWFAGTTALYFCSTLFETERLKQIGGFHSRKNLFQDAVAVVKLASRNRIVNIEEPKASFRKHAGEITVAVKVADWCDDSLQVIELIQELAGHDKAQLLDDSLQFFTRLNYRRAASVSERLKRMATYLMVWRKFGYRRRPPLKQLLGFQ